ncbi:MAG TPA: RloB family protein [Ramlibacter sp.]|nr:RloB family protein [Ramlibacter sp.]
MARKASSFARMGARFKPQPRILVLCEDSKSSLTYLREAAQHFRCHISVEISHIGNTDPRGIVAEAKRRQSDYEAVYCAFDRDDHASFDEALAHAAHKPSVAVVPSYPCYEYWLLLHFRKTRKPYASSGNRSAADQLIHDLRSEDDMGSYAKGEPGGLFERLLERLPDARVRAAEVLEHAQRDGSLNPSTRLHELIALFESLSKPQLL